MRQVCQAVVALFALAALVGLSGCASISPGEEVPPSGPVKTIALGPIDTVRSPGGDRVVRRFRRLLLTKLEQSGAFEQILSPAPAALPAGSVVVSGRFTDVDQGSEILRLLIGLGAGAPELSAEFHIRDAGGRKLASFEEDVTSLQGTGYSAYRSPVYLDEMVDGFAEDAAEAIIRWSRGEGLSQGWWPTL